MHFDTSNSTFPRSRPDGHLFAVALPALLATALSWPVSPSAAQAADDQGADVL